jgi:hypothetical protein
MPAIPRGWCAHWILRAEESASFFEKKEAKKLLLLGALAAALPWPAGPRVFWLLFFKKVTASF